jgi:hypothetical protein
VRNWKEIASDIDRSVDLQTIVTLCRELNESVLDEERRKAWNRVLASSAQQTGQHRNSAQTLA